MKELVPGVIISLILLAVFGILLLFFYKFYVATTHFDFARGCELECARQQYVDYEYRWPESMFDETKGKCFCYKSKEEIEFQTENKE